MMIRPQLSTWSPAMRPSLLNDFDQLVDSFLWPSSEGKYDFNPACDVSENPDHYLMSFDMPGVKREDIKIEVVENKLTISGERSKESSHENNSVFREERSYGKFQRSFRLPNTIDTEKIEANFENGVLTIAIPKLAIARGRTVEIQTGKSGLFGKLMGTKRDDNIMKDVKIS